MQRAAQAIAGPSRSWTLRNGGEVASRATAESRSASHGLAGVSESRRAFATRSRGQMGDQRRTSASQTRAASSSTTPSDRQSIYPDSRAAERRRPHQRSSLFAAKPIVYKSGSQGASIRRKDDDDPATLSAALAATRSGESTAASLGGRANQSKHPGSSRGEKIPFRSDPDLRHLLARLATTSMARHDLRSIEMLRIAQTIKERIKTLHQEAVRAARSKGEVPPPLPAMPKSAYLLLLETLGAQLRAKECKLIIGDMRLHNVDVDIDCLHHLLLAAICQGDVETIHWTLCEIADLPYDGPEVNTKKTSEGAIEPLLSREWTRNWTSGTYRLMFLRCKLSHDLEQCLALLASASQHQDTTIPDPSRNLTMTPFLIEVLTPSTVTAIISTAASVREPRLTADLASWFHEHVGRRQVPGPVWHMVLRVCAENDWFPGLARAWQRSINKAGMSSDEGLDQSILQCASRAGEVDFIKKVLHISQRRAGGSASFALQEWHLVPLLDAQCARFDFVGAIRTIAELTRITSFGGNDSRIDNNLLSFIEASGSSEDHLEKAVAAVFEVGRDTSSGGGVNVRVLNALLKNANSLRRFDLVYKLYRGRHYLRDSRASGDCNLPPLPPWLEKISAGEKGAETQLVIDEDLIDDSRDAKEQASTSRLTVQADINTFNELLNAAIYRQSRRLAKAVMAQLLAARVAANATTYERAIVLALTEPRYEAAFGYLEECKVRGIQPTPATYTVMAMRCLKDGDNRWVALAHDMVRQNYFLPKELHQAMVQDGHLTNMLGGEPDAKWVQSALRPKGYRSPFPAPHSRAHRS